MSSPVVLLLAWIVAKASAEGKRPEPAFQLAIAFVDAWSLYMWTSSPQFVATHAFRDALRVCLEIEPFPRHCEERLRRSNPVLDSRRHWIASLALAMTESHVVTPRACGASSTPRRLSFRPLMTLEYWIVRSSAQLRTRRTMTVENAAPSHAIADMRLTSAARCARDFA